MPLVKTKCHYHSKVERWGDADRIVTCYTLRFGKIRASRSRCEKDEESAGRPRSNRLYLCQMDLFEKPGDELCIGFLRWAIAGIIFGPSEGV